MAGDIKRIKEQLRVGIVFEGVEKYVGSWHAIREGLEVKLCPCPDGGSETYILCRSRDRREKEQAMHARFEKRLEEGLTKIAAGCLKRH